MTNCAPEAKVASFLPDFARNNNGNLAEQQRLVGPQRGADTTRPAPASLAAAAAAFCLLASSAAASASSFAEMKEVTCPLIAASLTLSGRPVASEMSRLKVDCA
jgi:cytochrome c